MYSLYKNCASKEKSNVCSNKSNCHEPLTNTFNIKEINAFIHLIRKMKSLACSICKMTCKTESKQQTSSHFVFICVGWFIVISRDPCLRHS